MPVGTIYFTKIREFLQKETGIFLEDEKQYLVNTKLEPLVKAYGFSGIDELISVAISGSGNGLPQKIIDSLTVTETLFFRDINVFNALEKFVLPELGAKLNPNEPLRIWCAACSTGQEPYSVAIILKENFSWLCNGRLYILATDINQQAIEKAKAGIYTQFEVNRGLPARLLVKYFTKHPNQNWEIDKSIRQMVQFMELNLIKDPYPYPPFDLILLRNVLIYFQDGTKKAVLDKIQRSLKPHGYLVLGSSESPIFYHDGFQGIHLGNATFYKKVS